MKDTMIYQLLCDLQKDLEYMEARELKKSLYHDLSVTELMTICTIKNLQNPTMTDIASSLRITLGTLTIAINRLAKKGYVQRKRLDTDRRIVLVQPTERGAAAAKIHETFERRAQQKFREALGKEDASLCLDMLRKLQLFYLRPDVQDAMHRGKLDK